jgi:aspartyl-tRNA(Asn)/glutamyl-tRNA(Gln) amidotransferase subunit A
MRNTMEITALTAIEMRDGIKEGKFTAKEVALAHFDRIEKFDGKVKAFLCLQKESALKKAEDIDKRIAEGKSVGILAGVPVAIKDNLCIDGVKTTCSSKLLKDFVPPYTAHVIKLIDEQDGVILGKTNLDEFAMGSSTENSGFGATGNPWNVECAPGGSSGGSAAAVAAGFAPLALGSDTGGSIRQPASFCGCVGMKPTYGMVSRYGLVAFGSSLDQIGPFSRTSADAALLMDVISGHDEKDSTSSNKEKPDFLANIDIDLSGVKIGVPEEFFGEGLDSEVEASVRAAIEKLKDMGATVQDVHLPHTKYAVPVYYIVATAEASSNLGRYDGVHYGHRATGAENIVELFSKSREEGFGDEVKRRIMLGTYVLSAGYYDAYYLKALKVRTLMAQDFEKAFGEVDFIITPTSPTVAFKMGEKVSDPLSMYLSDIYTISANIAGIPGINIPCGMSNNLPVGVQILGSHFKDDSLLAVANKLEKALGNGGQVVDIK